MQCGIRKRPKNIFMEAPNRHANNDSRVDTSFSLRLKRDIFSFRSLLGSFSIDDGNGNDNATNKEFDWSSHEKIIVLHVRHALKNKSVPSSAKQQREITIFTVLMTT